MGVCGRGGAVSVCIPGTGVGTCSGSWGRASSPKLGSDGGRWGCSVGLGGQSRPPERLLEGLSGGHSRGPGTLKGKGGVFGLLEVSVGTFVSLSFLICRMVVPRFPNTHHPQTSQVEHLSKCDCGQAATVRC